MWSANTFQQNQFSTRVNSCEVCCIFYSCWLSCSLSCVTQLYTIKQGSKSTQLKDDALWQCQLIPWTQQHAMFEIIMFSTDHFKVGVTVHATIKNFVVMSCGYVPRPLFTERTDVLPQDLLMSRSREIRVYAFPIALKFDWHLGSSAAEMPVKYQSDKIIIRPNLAASRLHETWRQDVWTLR